MPCLWGGLHGAAARRPVGLPLTSKHPLTPQVKSKSGGTRAEYPQSSAAPCNRCTVLARSISQEAWHAGEEPPKDDAGDHEGQQDVSARRHTFREVAQQEYSSAQQSRRSAHPAPHPSKATGRPLSPPAGESPRTIVPESNVHRKRSRISRHLGVHRGGLFSGICVTKILPR